MMIERERIKPWITEDLGQTWPKTTCIKSVDPSMEMSKYIVICCYFGWHYLIKY